VQGFFQEATPLYDDREPAAFINAEGQVELYWSSSRAGPWSVWRSALLNLETFTWETPVEVTSPPYSQRTPLPLLVNDRTWMIFRSNESLAYNSSVYGASKTLDFRYAGSTTADTHNLAKKALWGQYKDFQTYTYDTGKAGQRNDDDWHGRDTVGIFLTAETDDPVLLTRNRNLLRNVLPYFLPIHVRLIFSIDEPAVHQELVYTYDFPAEPQRLIGESTFDTILAADAEMVGGPGEMYQDKIPGWTWVHAWSAAYPNHRTTDFRVTPTDTHLRTWHIGVTAGG
jgi:hypothetical protein